MCPVSSPNAPSFGANRYTERVRTILDRNHSDYSGSQVTPLVSPLFHAIKTDIQNANLLLPYGTEEPEPVKRDIRDSLKSIFGLPASPVRLPFHSRRVEEGPHGSYHLPPMQVRRDQEIEPLSLTSSRRTDYDSFTPTLPQRSLTDGSYHLPPMQVRPDQEIEPLSLTSSRRTDYDSFTPTLPQRSLTDGSYHLPPMQVRPDQEIEPLSLTSSRRTDYDSFTPTLPQRSLTDGFYRSQGTSSQFVPQQSLGRVGTDPFPMSAAPASGNFATSSRGHVSVVPSYVSDSGIEVVVDYQMSSRARGEKKSRNSEARGDSAAPSYVSHSGIEVVENHHPASLAQTERRSHQSEASARYRQNKEDLLDTENKERRKLGWSAIDKKDPETKRTKNIGPLKAEIAASRQARQEYALREREASQFSLNTTIPVTVASYPSSAFPVSLPALQSPRELYESVLQLPPIQTHEEQYPEYQHRWHSGHHS